MKDRSILINLALVLAILFGTIGFIQRPVKAATSDLFFSEYIEGSSNNKALEIYNGTGSAVDLGDYKVVLYSNGNTDPGNTLTWDPGTMLADGEVYIIANSGAVSAITDIADITSNVTYFNGDDAIALQKSADDSFIDVFGTIGEQTDWAGEVTLVRKETICQGDTDPDDTFDPTVEWDSYAQNTFDYLGSHTADCGAVVSEPKINEFVFYHSGTDAYEYIEVFGDAESDYSSYSVLQIEGDSNKGLIISVDEIGVTDTNGFWWTGFLGGQYQNGTQTLLLVKDFTGLSGDDLDTDDDGELDLTPWSDIVDEVAVFDGDSGDLTYGTPVLGPNYDGVSTYAPGGASRIPDGYDTESESDWIRNDFDLAGIPGEEGSISEGEAYNTPGELNEVYVVEAAELAINEIDYDQDSTDMAEFIELKNNSSSAVDLGDYALELVNGSGGGASIYATISLPAESIAAGDYFVVCANAATVANCDLDVSTDTNLIQNGAPDAVGLRFESTLVDTVSYAGDTGMPYTEGSGAGLEDDPSVDGSIQRCPDGTDTDQNNVDFVFAEPPSPGTENSCTSEVPEVVINEIMQNPDAVADTSGEWLELYNPTEASIDINGWTLSDNGADSHTIDNGGPLEIPAGGYMILGNNSDQATNGGVDVDYSYGSNLFLGNSDDEVLLFDAESTEIDRVEYDGGPTFPDPTGASMSLIDPTLDNNIGANWCTSITQFGDGDLGTPGGANICTPPAPEVLINEVDADTPGTDELEFVELFDGGTGNTPLDGLVVVFYNGNGDTSYAVYDLDGFSTDVNGYFLLGNADVDPTPSIVYSNDSLQNGADAVALYEGDASGFPNGTAVTTENLLDAIVYDTDDADDTDLLVLLNAGQPQVNESAGSGSTVDSNQRCPNGSGGLRNTDTYTQFIPTPGSENCTLPPEACGDDYTPIYEIQGSGFSTPLSGTNLATEGIVVGDFQVGGKNGFFIQDMTGDGDPSTSDGIFVYAPGSLDVNMGDHVRVRGTATEYFDLTQVGSVSQVWLCEAGVTLPEATELVLPVESADDFEQLEGMYVTIPQDLVIAEYFDFDRYGEIVLSSERFMTFTAANEPDVAGFTASEEEYFLSTITLDDGRTSQNPDPAIHPNGSEFTLVNRFRGGDLVANVTGVMDYNFGLYKIQPTQGADYTSVNPRPETLELEEGSLTVASFNVLNYFTTIDTGAYVCGPVEFIDVIGKIGEDPGDYWGTDPKTQDQTLIRKADVCDGDWESIDDFDPVGEWDSFGQDYFDDLGLHTTTCPSFEDLIISEYIEGSSNNKALEIFNGTGATVDLRGYKVVTYVNGDGVEPTNVLTWDSETLLEDGDVYIIGNADASVESTILDKADILLSYPSVVHYNGDDVVALMKAGPDGMECRGADTAEELTRQRAKILAAMSEIDADVFGLMEIENERFGPPSNYAVADLVAGLNDIVGAGTYDYVATGAIGTDAIKVALLYKPASVTPVGDYQILDSTVDPRFIDTKNRPTLAQVFEDNLTGETFTVAVNHLKSKGSDCDDLGDPDLLDGAGNCNLTRLAAAEAMVDWLADETIFSEVENVLIIGDLNSYDKEDPIDAIKLGADDTAETDDDYFDMIYEILGEDAYGYVFDGKIGYLDYALASTSLMDNILDVVLWHINADEPDIIDYDMSFKKDAQDALYVADKYRSSDHDPVIVSLRMNEGPTAIDDMYETDQDVTLDVPAPGVMANDSDPNPNDFLWVDVRTEPSHGELTLNDDGSFSYVPDPGFFGVDTFEYYLLALPPEMRSDYMDIGLVTITVKPKYQIFLPLTIND